jgi:hypothetical protein
MLTNERIRRIAADIADGRLPPRPVVRVTSAPDIGTDGEYTLRVLVVLRAASPADVTGDQAATLLSDLQDRLRADGETRFASIEYATDEELAMHGGS